jgi:hypothetical protein
MALFYSTNLGNNIHRNGSGDLALLVFNRQAIGHPSVVVKGN